MSNLSNGAGTAGSGLDQSPFPGHIEGVLSLTITPEKREYPAGSFPDFKVTIKNTGKTPEKFCRYMLRYRLMLAMTVKEEKGAEYGLYPFHPGNWEKFQARDIVVLGPGQTITESLKLSNIREEGWVFISTADQPPAMTSKLGIGGFPPGTYTFNSGISPTAAIYVGLDGIHDNRLDAKTLPEQIPGAPTSNYADVNREALRSLATVKFTSKKA